MSEWRQVQLADLIDIKHGYAFKGEYFSSEGPGPILLTPGNFAVGGGFISAKPKYYAGSVPPEFRLRAGDLVVTMTDLSKFGDTLGYPAIIPAGGEYLHNQRIGLVKVTAPHQVCKEYIYYSLKTEAYRQHVLAGATGSTVRHTSPSRIRSYVLTLPAIAVQRAIVAVLGVLDDKIAVNDRIAATSDDLASTLLDELLLQEDNTHDVRLADVAAVNQRKVFPAIGARLRYIDISSVSRGNIEWPHTISWEDAPSRARRGVSQGDTIWSSVRPGRKSFALMLDDDPEIVVSTGFAVLTPTKVGPAFLYEVTKRDEFVQYLESVAEGSAYPAVRTERFERAIIPLPPEPSLARFEAEAIALRRRIHSAQIESRALTQLRDTLLPRLMSGKIRVREVEKVLDEVT